MVPTKVDLLDGIHVGKDMAPETLVRLQEWYSFYHRQWWCHREMFHRFRWQHGLLNVIALLIVAAGMIVGPVLDNALLTACLTAAGTVVKGWNELKHFAFKMDMTRYAFTTYEKTMNELRTYARGLPIEELDGFLIKMQVTDDTIAELVPPISDRIAQSYDRQYDISEETSV